MKSKGIAQAAREVPCPEGALRRLDRQGIVHPARDPWGRRLFGEDDVQAARKHLASRTAGVVSTTT
jgi:DNA-binding transcriptional MerR regulator